MFEQYDVIVVGAGHAGCEAAAAAANMGSKTLLITMNMQNMGQMSCNPAMGGIAKGQIIREIDALGGYSGIVSDETLIQFRMLNTSKGPAMWSPRSQNDRMLFSLRWRELLEQTPNLDFIQDTANELIIKDNIVQGVKTNLGYTIYSKSVVLTNGTFLNGIIHIGEKQMRGGRISENASMGLTEQLSSIGFEAKRLKTGTPPRIDGRSLNYKAMTKQDGDKDIVGFSYLNTKKIKPDEQIPCWITHTSNAVHNMLKTGFEKSPMYMGRIQGSGPRYCPSIEDKISRYADKNTHQLFVEPEGFNTVEIYLNGFSTSLPEDVQYKALKLIDGFENVKMFRPGYAIEYDYFPPTQLKKTLETHLIKNLFFAGQINGTTGYEEAAGQGIIAGINAHLNSHNQAPFILNRDEAYIGVLIDDLIQKGNEDEPYRMFTSRAEFRTLLRQDNADLRLTEKSFNIGLAKQERYQQMITKKQHIAALTQNISTISLDPNDIKTYLESVASPSLPEQKIKLTQLLLRPEVSLKNLISQVNILHPLLTNQHYTDDIIQQTEIDIKYKKYIEKELLIVEKMNALKHLTIPPNFDYNKVPALSNEARQRLKKYQPTSIAELHNISGINPSDIQILIVYMGR